MKIGIVCFPTYGGSGIIATELALELANKHEVHLVSYDQPVRLEETDFSFHKVEQFRYYLFEDIPCCYTLALTSKLTEIIESHNLDLIHAHYAVPNSVSAYLAKKISGDRVKVVTTLHGTDSYLVGSHPSYKEVTQFSIQRSDGLTAVSEYLRERTLDEFDISRDITVIPNFVDPYEFRRKEEESDRKIICHSSNFRPIKRIPDIVRAFEIISEEIKSELVFIGDGPERHSARTLAKRLGISDSVHFLGNVKNVNEVLGKSDLFLLPSEDESFGVAALEAMSCEVPVIASNVGGLRELITDGVDGYLVKVGDVETLAQRSVRILQDPKLQRELGKNARKKVLDKYTPDIVVPKYEELYHEVLSKK